MEKLKAKSVTLKPGEELRLEVDFSKTVYIKLIKGNAEIFGAELGSNTYYEFSCEKFAIYTWEGCEIEIRGELSSEYTSNETPMNVYMNLHLALQQLRDKAKQQGSEGPRLLILGPTDSGKTTLCKILTNYAVKQDETPVLVNLDTSEGMVSVPGSISATCISRFISPEDGFMSYGVTGSSGKTDSPLVYHYGNSLPNKHLSLFQKLLKCLANNVNKQIETNKSAQNSGFIIDTGGHVESSSYALIDQIIDLFKVNLVLIIGNEKLYNDYIKKYNDQPNISVAKVPKSGGVVDRSSLYIQNYQNNHIKQYFYGTNSEKLQSFSKIVKISDISLYKIGQDTLAPSSTLPLGETRKISETQITKVEIDEKLSHYLVAILHLDPVTNQEKLDNNEIHIKEEDTESLLDEDLVLNSPVLGYINMQVFS
ncbi:hypothetical protein BB559_006512 [Furculomyces boomerangus]|uniref:Polynucleotide 5'-hydroxyl-kinase GRC3 n=1 Tax=Furculomyces boomerangus TaxID=61424 RepID=A0A2T9Y2E7_9FUNG|nr:hypothetical protein BB559_006512 [Furculomyces boomerangus]